MSWAQRYNPDTFGMEWYSTDDNSVAIFDRAGSGGGEGGAPNAAGVWGVGADINDSPYTQKYGEMKPLFDNAPMLDLGASYGAPTPQKPWFTANGKYIIPQGGLEGMDQMSGMPSEGVGYFWKVGDAGGTVAVPNGEGVLHKLAPGIKDMTGNADFTYARVYDKEPTMREFRNSKDAGFWQDTFTNFMGGDNKPWWGSGPVMMLGPFLAALGAAGGAIGAGTSALGGTEAMASLGGSATGAGGSALSFGDLLGKFGLSSDLFGSTPTGGTPAVTSPGVDSFLQTAGGGGPTGGGMDWWDDFMSSIGIDSGSTMFSGGGLSNADIMSGIGGGSGGWDYGEFLKSIGVDPSSTQFSGGTLSNADIMAQIGGGSSGLGLSDIAKYGKNLLSALGGGGAGNGLGGIGALLGALAGGLGANQKPAGTTTTVQDIPDWLKPYVISNLSGGANAQASLLQPNGVMDAATAQYLKTINGDYLDPATNPWLDKTYRHASDLVGAGVDSRFSSAGRYGSGAHQGVLQEGMNNLATNIFGGNYQAERGRQAAAIGGAPTFLTGRAGAAYAPYSGFADLFPAGVRSTSTPYFSNTAGGILSGALAGSQLSKLFG